MNIACFLVANGVLEKAIMPEEMLLELTKSLRTKGNEIAFFENKSVEVEGVYIPAKGSKTKLIVFQDEN